MPSKKPDAAVERLVRKWTVEHELGPARLRAIINEARQSAARECAEMPEMTIEAEQAIRERFGLEGE